MDLNTFKLQMYYTVFYRVDGVYYCHRMLPFSILLRFEEPNWVEVPLDTIDTEKEKALSTDESASLFLDCPPFDAIDEAENAIVRKQNEAILERAKNTKHRVIGWTDCISSMTLLPDNKEDDDRYAAYIKDCIDHGYCFTGQTYQDREMFPVLDDYTFGDFSRRGWGGVMAIVHGTHEAYGYAAYTDEGHSAVEKDVWPEEGLYPEVKAANPVLELTESEFDCMVELGKKDGFSRRNPVFFLPVRIPKDGYYFPCQEAKIRCGEREEEVMICNIWRIETPEDKAFLLEQFADDFQFGYEAAEPNFEVDGPYLLLGLSFLH